MKILLNNIKELLISLWKLFLRVIPLLILLSIIFDMWTDQVDLETIIMMLLLILDALTDISKNINTDINLTLTFGNEKASLKGKRKNVKKD